MGENNDEILRLLESKLAAETKINNLLHLANISEGICHYSDGRRDALITAIEIVKGERPKPRPDFTEEWLIAPS